MLIVTWKRFENIWVWGLGGKGGVGGHRPLLTGGMVSFSLLLFYTFFRFSLSHVFSSPSSPSSLLIISSTCLWHPLTGIAYWLVTLKGNEDTCHSVHCVKFKVVLNHRGSVEEQFNAVCTFSTSTCGNEMVTHCCSNGTQVRVQHGTQLTKNSENFRKHFSTQGNA